MKKLTVGFIILFFPLCIGAQTMPQQPIIPELTGIDPHSEQGIDVIIKAQKAHTKAANNSRAQAEKIFYRTSNCIQKVNYNQTGRVLGCLTPLQKFYEQERSVDPASVRNLANTLSNLPFLAKDQHSIFVIPFLQQTLGPVDEEVQQELSQQLHWESAPSDLEDKVTHFMKEMSQWRTHLIEDSLPN